VEIPEARIIIGSSQTWWTIAESIKSMRKLVKQVVDDGLLVNHAARRIIMCVSDLTGTAKETAMGCGMLVERCSTIPWSVLDHLVSSRVNMGATTNAPDERTFAAFHQEHEIELPTPTTVGIGERIGLF
jgi:hypothetical protein